MLTELRVENAGDPLNQRLLLRTSLGEGVAIGPEHPLIIGVDRTDSIGNKEPHPTVDVRAGLLGLISRSVFYQLAELVESHAGDRVSEVFGVWSEGVFFPLA